MKSMVLFLALAASDTKDATWSRADLPLIVLLAPEAIEHHGAVARAVLIVNRACGCQLYDFPRPASLVYVRSFMSTGQGFRGHVLVRADGEAEPPRAHAEPVFARPGRLYSVVITLPRMPVPDWILRGMALHEAIHSTGLLGHEDSPDAARFQVVLPGQRVSEADRRWLRRQYGGAR